MQKLLFLLTALCLLAGGLLAAQPGWAQNETASASPAAAEPLQGSAYRADYVIGPGDTLSLRENQMGVLIQDARIQTDGSMHIPLLGKVFLGGLSVREAKQLLEERYARYFVKPTIYVQMINQRPLRVYVTGAVSHPGVYLSGKSTSPESQRNLVLGEYSSLYWYNGLHLTDALLLAGGLEYNANATDVRIKRGGPNPVTIHVNLMDLFNGSPAQDITLRDQDVIEVSQLADNELVMNADWDKLVANNIGMGEFNVNVLGAVSKPGIYEVKTSDTVLNAISKAGGFSDLANQKKVYILRTTLSGQVVKRELNLADKQLASDKPFQQWAALLPKDMVFVEESNAIKARKVGSSLVNKASGAAMYPLLFRLLRDDSPNN